MTWVMPCQNLVLNKGAGASGPTTRVLDTFTGVNGTTLPNHTPDIAPVGAAWASFGPNPQPSGAIQSNTARITDNGDGQARGFLIESGVSDCTIQLTMIGNAINPAWGGIAFRDNGTNRWVARQNAESDQAQLFNPAGALVDSAALVSGVNDQLLFTVVLTGTSITATIRNVTTSTEVELTADSGTNQTATKHGISVRTAFGAGANDKFDDFSVVA